MDQECSIISAVILYNMYIIYVWYIYIGSLSRISYLMYEYIFDNKLYIYKLIYVYVKHILCMNNLLINSLSILCINKLNFW